MKENYCHPQGRPSGAPLRHADSGGKWFYVSSLSARTLIYKGMLMSEQVEKYYDDLRNPAVTTAMALVHSRFSTNTFPSWDRAHPNRCIAHNGEINTLRGNVNWIKAAQANFKSETLGGDIKKVVPVINTDGSDSAQFDNCVELLVMAGRELPHAMMMMIPSRGKSREHGRRAPCILEFHSCLIEPWDGPASMRSPTASASVRASTAMACARRVITSRKTTWSSWHRKRACCRLRRTHRDQRPFAARQNVSRGYRARPHHRGRRAEEKIRWARSRMLNGWPSIMSGWKNCRCHRSARSRGSGKFCSINRRLVTRLKTCDSSSARWRTTVCTARLDGHGHAAGRALAEAGSCSIIISNNFSRRSRPAD